MALDLTKAAGTKSINRVLQKSVEQENELAKLNISIDKLKPCEYNSEIYDMDENELQFLEKGIKEEGFHSTVTVCTLPDTPKGEYIIISGHRRVEAARRAGEQYVPAIVKPVKDKAEMLKILISSNRKNRNDKPLTHANEIKFYREVIAPANGITSGVREYIAKELNMSEGQVAKYEALLKLIPTLQELANSPEYSFSAFSKAAQLKEIEQEELYKRIIQYVEKDEEHIAPTRNIILKMIDSIKEGKELKLEFDSIEKVMDSFGDEKDVFPNSSTIKDYGSEKKSFQKSQNQGSVILKDDSKKDIHRNQKPEMPKTSTNTEKSYKEESSEKEGETPDEDYPYKKVDFKLFLSSIRGSMELSLEDNNYDFTDKSGISNELSNIEKLIETIKKKI